MSHQINSSISVVGLDIGKNSFHVIGLDQRGAIVLRQKWLRGQAAKKAAAELLAKYPMLKIEIYDASSKSRIPVK
jgi:hypothetical protein